MSSEKELEEQLIGVDLSATMEQFQTPQPGSQPDSVSFGDVSVCRTADDTATLVAGIISDNLGQNDIQKQKLVEALTAFFGKIGIGNEETFAYMGRATSLSPDIIKGEASADALTLPVMLCLKETAALTEKTTRSGLYLTRRVTFQQLEQLGRQFDQANSAIQGRLSQQTQGQGAPLPQKMPSLKVPRFNDDAIKGDAFIDEVESAFKSEGMQRYLQDESFCDANLQWSTAFASRLRESLHDSTTVRFMAAELKKVDNCAKLWAAVVKHLTSIDMKVARALEQWKQLFSLQCESMDQFPRFHSDVREAVDVLTTAESEAIRDEVFMRAFLCKALDVPELQTHTK